MEQRNACDTVTAYATYLMSLPKNLEVTDNHKSLNLYELKHTEELEGKNNSFIGVPLQTKNYFM